MSSRKDAFSFLSKHMSGSNRVRTSKRYTTKDETPFLFVSENCMVVKEGRLLQVQIIYPSSPSEKGYPNTFSSEEVLVRWGVARRREVKEAASASLGKGVLLLLAVWKEGGCTDAPPASSSTFQAHVKDVREEGLLLRLGLKKRTLFDLYEKEEKKEAQSSGIPSSFARLCPPPSTT